MVRISDLYALQELDTEIDGLERALDELRSRHGADESTGVLEERIAELEEVVKTARQERRGASDEADDGRAKVVAVEEKLYGGSITNAKELRDLQKELESLQRQQAARDETALSALAAVELAETDLARVRAELSSGQSSWEAEQSQVSGEVEGLEAQVAALRQRRQAASRPVDAPTMALYERLRRMRAGRAVARVQRGACLGCRISLPSQVFQKARSGLAVVQCTSCERILYVG